MGNCLSARHVPKHDKKTIYMLKTININNIPIDEIQYDLDIQGIKKKTTTVVDDQSESIIEQSICYKTDKTEKTDRLELSEITKINDIKRTEKKKKIFKNEYFDNQTNENFRKMEKIKTQEDEELIKNSLKNHFVLVNLSETQKKTIIKHMFYSIVEENEYIFLQGNNASHFFIIDTGQVEIIISHDKTKILKRGEGFGELSLIYNTKRTASARAIENCGIWAIDRHTFKKVLRDLVLFEYDENRKFIEGLTCFHCLTGEQKDAITCNLVPQHFNPGEYIIHEGDEADSFYILREGNVVVIRKKVQIGRISPGNAFGEQSLYYKTTRRCSIQAVDNVKLFALGRNTLISILGDQLQYIAFRNTQKWAFEKSKILHKLTKLQIEILCDKTTIKKYKMNEVVYHQGSFLSAKIIILLQGSVITAKSLTKIAKIGELWGDEFLLKENDQTTTNENIIMENDGILAEITKSELLKCIGGLLEHTLKINEASHEKKMIEHKSLLKDFASNVELSDLICCKKLGIGQCGFVYLVKSKSLDEYFALRCLSKQQIIEKNLEKSISNEKLILDKIQFPFIMQYVKTFQDENFKYFLVEYINGIELFEVIKYENCLTIHEAKFYAGQLILTLEYLHSQKIIHRDFKPENFMVDDKGYLRLIDVNTAKLLSNKSHARTFTVIGTPHYMAPDIIHYKGYGFYADLWSLGVMIYEFICGCVPFGEDTDDPYLIYEEASINPVIFKPFVKDKKAKTLVEQLLSKVPEMRLLGSYENLKAHPWFEYFNWDKLLDRELEAPYIPPKHKLLSAENLARLCESEFAFLDEINVVFFLKKYEELCRSPYLRYIKHSRKNSDWNQNFLKDIQYFFQINSQKSQKKYQL